MNLVFTLFENDYHLGAGVLVNSLLRAGFRGSFVAGFRNEPPKWFGQAGRLAASCNFNFVPRRIETEGHLAQLKPSFAISLLQEFPDVENFFYFDPDIVIRGPWEFFENWNQFGIALVEEIVTRGMSERHPQRLMWGEWAKTHGYSVTRSLNMYFNSGFFGFRQQHKSFLTQWDDILQKCRNDGLVVNTRGGHLKKYSSSKMSFLFNSWDQDAMNLALMLSEADITSMGPEAMDFIPSGKTMSHAVGASKPWNQNYVAGCLQGKAIRMADRAYWEIADKPISVFSPRRVFQKRLAIKISSFLQRFYGK